MAQQNGVLVKVSRKGRPYRRGIDRTTEHRGESGDSAQPDLLPSWSFRGVWTPDL